LNNVLIGEQNEVGLQVEKQFVEVAVALGTVDHKVDVWTLELVAQAHIHGGQHHLAVDGIKLTAQVHVAVLLRDGGVQSLAHENHDQQGGLTHVLHHARVLFVLCQLGKQNAYHQCAHDH